MDRKTCTVCKLEKPIDEFYNSSIYADGKGYRCKDCDKKANAINYKFFVRKRRLLNNYNLTLEKFLEMEKAQDCKCAICGCKKDDKKVRVNFAVDHCKHTGEVRGLLCNQCNRGIGMLEHSVKYLQKAIDYLNKA